MASLRSPHPGGPPALATDVVVVGSGLIGAAVAGRLLGRGLSVAIVEAGSPLGPRPGGHVLDMPLASDGPEVAHAAAAARLFALSSPRAGPWSGTLAGMPADDGAGSSVNPHQTATGNLPAAAICPCVGGAGTVWSGLAPRLDALAEGWPVLAPDRWRRRYAEAEALLNVAPADGAGSPAQALIAERLSGSGRSAVAAPRAGTGAGRGWRPTAPGDLVDLTGAGTAGRLAVLSDHVARRVLSHGGRTLGIAALDRRARRPVTIAAGAVVLANGPVGVAQLLWTSGFGRDAGSALGRHLMDHPVAFACAALESSAFGAVLDHPPGAAAVMLPITAQRPWLGFVVQDKFPLARFGGRVDRRLLVNLYLYGLTAPRWDSRVTFRDDAPDMFGLPRPVFDYRRDGAAREADGRMLAALRELIGVLGHAVPAAPPQILAAGGSMHLMGTHRIGPQDDGRSVCGPDGRVRGTDGLFAVGTGAIPGPSAANPTLTATALALEAADRLVDPGGGAAGAAAETAVAP